MGWCEFSWPDELSARHEAIVRISGRAEVPHKRTALCRYFSAMHWGAFAALLSLTDCVCASHVLCETFKAACEWRDRAARPEASVEASMWQLEVRGVNLLLVADEVDHEIGRERGGHCHNG